MTRISSYGSYLSTLGGLTNGQRQIDDLSSQLNTLKKSVDVSYYGTQTQRLLDLRADYAKRQSYTNTIDQSMTRVKSYNTIMERMVDMASELSNTSRLPQGPGAVRTSTVVNSNPDSMQVSIDQTNSAFKVEATYTISAVPSSTGPAGSFDVTVTDGLGGKSTNTVNMKQVPPQVDADRFVISGGPGDGAVIKLNVEKLAGGGTSSFDVTWPDLASTKELIKGMTTELQSMLNEKVGDRYLFAGSRVSTQPVGDIISAKQIMRTTLVGERGDAGEVYEMVLNGKRFTYTTTGQEKSLDEVLTNSNGTGIVDQMQAYNPPFNATLSVSNGIVTATANNVGDSFTLTSAVYDNGSHDNTVLPAPGAVNASEAPYTIQEASETQNQIDHVKLHGNEADVGDVFNISVGARSIVQNENAPPQVIIAGPTQYSYAVSPADTDILNGSAPVPAGFTAPSSMSNWVAQKLSAQINGDPASTVTASIDPADDTNIILTAKANNSEFQTTASINNAGNTSRLITKEVPPLAGQDVFADLAEPPNLPFYDVEFSTQTSNSDAYALAKMTVDEGLQVTYGVSSNDPAIQKLVSSLRRLTQAISQPGRYSEIMSEGRDLAIAAQNELKGVSARVVNASTTMQNAQTRHANAMAQGQSEMAQIEGVDENEVAVKLQAALNRQQASYTVTGRTASLSLVNFLS
jgi:hypothetical protein